VIVVALLLSLVLAAPAAATGSGGAVAPIARAYTVSPAAVTEGQTVTFAFTAPARALTRIDLIAPGKPAVRAKLGRVGATGKLTATWSAALTPGQYTARLVVTIRGTKHYLRQPLTVNPVAPAPAALTASTNKLFPVQGPFNFGAELSKFGAGRTGHIHQGQDIAAAEGTPVVSPIAGTVHWTAYQAKGAGYYVVVAGADGRHYVFMHLQAGSTAVAKGAAVTAGQRLANVGNTGGSDGPHLHFEIWLNGWRASKASLPIDPLPELEAWSAST